MFFFNDTATTEIYALSLHDALPISFSLRQTQEARRQRSPSSRAARARSWPQTSAAWKASQGGGLWRKTRRRPSSLRRSSDRKSTRLNSSHANISYAVFCLKKKKASLIRT